MKTIVTTEEYLEHERYYRHMMKKYPDRYVIIVDMPPEEPLEPKEEYVSLKEAGAILGRSPATIKTYIKRGLIRGKKTTRWVVLKRDVEAFTPQKKKWPRKTTQKRRQEIINRDGGKCVKCGASDNLEVHHITHRADGGTDEGDNLITLCAKCHAEEHKGEPIHNLMVSRFN